jgi:ribosomal protein S18 acetylase RimI-like enzyme
MNVMRQEETVTFRPAVEKDSQAIYRLKREAFGGNYLQFTIYRSEKAVVHISRSISSEDEIFIVAERRRELEGYANVGFTDHQPILNYIAVANTSRGAGIGRRLLQAIESETRRRGFGTLSLNVFESNPGVVEWYRKSGYGIVSQSFLYRIDLARAMRKNSRVHVDSSLWKLALAAEEQNGFSKIVVGVTEGEMTLGLIEGVACKLLGYRGISLDEAIAAAAGMVKGARRELIVSSKETPGPGCQFQLLNLEVSLRMAKQL